jgi:hypothetical protein
MNSMRIASVGHALFVALLIGEGIQGLITGQFTSVWQPVPRGVLGREVLAYLCALLSLASGIGLLWRRTTALAARVLLGSLVLWLLAWRVPAVFVASVLEGSWSLAHSMVMTGATWVLFVWFATDWDRRHLGFATGAEAKTVSDTSGRFYIPFLAPGTYRIQAEATGFKLSHARCDMSKTSGAMECSVNV